MSNSYLRRPQALNRRQQAAQLAYNRPHPDQISNGDENRFPNYIGNFTKGLPHDSTTGEVDPEAYQALLKALNSAEDADFEAIPFGFGPPGARKFVSPQAGLAYDLEGPDAGALTMSPAPRVDSAQAAGEAGEVYWMAVLRDVNFTDYKADPKVADAVSDLNAFSDFRGPKIGGAVTRGTLFRGLTAGDLIGPYISQFLLAPITYGTLRIRQRQRTAQAGKDYMTTFTEWLEVQNGKDTTGQDQFDSQRRFIRNGRDLATYVHFDALFEAYLNACLILLDKKAPFDVGIPYRTSQRQEGFATFGSPHVLTLVAEVATRALKAVWHQKWFVHRRLRPESYGGLVHQVKANGAGYPLHPDILNSQAVQEIFNCNKSYLLPMAFPEGSPMHPAYGAGHATVAGACVTILKAWFDESYVLTNPKVPDADGLTLIDYTGPDKDQLTVGGELNKLAANISIGRNMAGVHWFTDYSESIRLGEAIAIGILQEQKITYNEDGFFTLTKFDGTQAVI